MKTYKIITKDLKEFLKFGFSYDEEYGDYYKNLFCYINVLNPNKSLGTIFMLSENELSFAPSGLFENEFINKNNFMQKFLDLEIEKLIEAGLIEN